MGLIVKVLRDWMPAMLGLAITAGVAPLLFLQVLYRRPFYTANLLLFHRFMMLLPALIVAYYLLYLIKSRPLVERGPAVRVAVTSLALACFFYAAWAWTENHILSLHAEIWTEFYTSGRWFFRDAEIWPRLGYWMTVSFPTLATVVAWQLHWGRRLQDPADLDLAARRLRILAILGLATSAAEAWLWQLWLDASARQVVLGSLALPYGFLVLAGMGIQAAGWLTVRSGSDLNPRRLSILSAGSVLTIFATLVVREARRLAAIEVATLYDAHRHAAQVGGLGVFLLVFTLNAVAIATCVLVVKLRAAADLVRHLARLRERSARFLLGRLDQIVQEVVQFLEFPRSERTEDLLNHGVVVGEGLGQPLAPGSRQIQPVGPPVLGVGSPLDPTRRLGAVDQSADVPLGDQ